LNEITILNYTVVLKNIGSFRKIAYCLNVIDSFVMFKSQTLKFQPLFKNEISRKIVNHFSWLYEKKKKKKKNKKKREI